MCRAVLSWNHSNYQRKVWFSRRSLHKAALDPMNVKESGNISIFIWMFNQQVHPSSAKYKGKLCGVLIFICRIQARQEDRKEVQKGKCVLKYGIGGLLQVQGHWPAERVFFIPIKQQQMETALFGRWIIPQVSVYIQKKNKLFLYHFCKKWKC